MRYKITIKEIESIEPSEFSGEFGDGNEEMAISEAKDFYAEALDTFEDNIEIINITKI